MEEIAGQYAAAGIVPTIQWGATSRPVVDGSPGQSYAAVITKRPVVRQPTARACDGHAGPERHSAA
ncbi:hypothetical protein ACWGOK_25095 [Streptomyces eurythermus]